ncbi:MAG: excinuclease ABC C subunit domain-containing protein [Parcubacteria group bacterium GW2011_GWA2_33_14]|nr:MAG: excinuclease ABC C subunit domain-containing protein [Parcubacteria group bacterium GW2011_GWA2_33_14]
MAPEGASWVRIPPFPPSPAIAGFGGHSPPEERDGGIQKMHTVYILKCVDGKPYTGCTEDLEERLGRHNKGHVPATESRRPIKLITHIVFSDKYKAFEFEKYLKSGSGRAFLNKHLIS